MRTRLEFISPKGMEPVVEVPPGGPELFAEMWESVLTGGLAPANDDETCGFCDLRPLCAEAPL